jgi:ketosteroid isomerase-like protein
MRTKNLNFLIFLTFILILSCQAPITEAPAIDLDAVKAEIQTMEDAYAVAQNAKDADGVVAYYSDDAQSLGPDKPTLVGKETILMTTKDDMAKDSTNNTTRFEVLDLWASGNLAVEVGRSINTSPDGKISYGKYISIFEKREGKYICIRDIYNDDQPEEEKGEE